MEFKGRLMRSYTMLSIFFVCLSLVFAATLEQNYTKRALKQQEIEKHHVLILGAGMAGIRAARTLYDAGIKNFLVLEATDRIGGRLLLKNIEEKYGGGTVELGGNWVHGTKNNPIWTLVDKAGLHHVKTMNKPTRKKYIVLGENGVDVTAEDGHKEMATAEKCIEKLKKIEKEDFSVRYGLNKCNWIPKHPAQTAIEYYYHDFDAADPPELISSGLNLLLKSGDELRNYIDSTGGRQVLISDRRGYASIISEMAKQFKSQVLLNHEVEKISLQENEVTVQVKAGVQPIIIKADFVLVTFSIGVLQAKAPSMFNPPLPQPFMESLFKIKMGNYLKIFMKFSQRFWHHNVDYIFYASKERGFYPVWQNLPGRKTDIPENDNILLVTVTGQKACELREDRNIIERELFPILKKVYPQQFKNPNDPNNPQLLAIELKNWAFDERFHGAYSHPKVGTTSQDFNNLLLPIGGKLFFAGEGLSELYYGFLHGAYLTGEGQAKKIKQKIRPEKILGDYALRKKIPRNGTNY